MVFDKIIIGAGLYGLYSALYCGGKGEKVLVIECDSSSFMRATYINQARVHMGYHYPRSYSTAIKSAHYFKRFLDDYNFCIHKSFQQIYATSTQFSWTNANDFKRFCRAADILCDDVDINKYFKPNMCDGAFLTEEYTYDAQILKKFFLNEISKCKSVDIIYNLKIESIQELQSHFVLKCSNNEMYETDFLLNATYASTNQISYMLGYESFKIKYELCEIILCNVDEKFKDIGITVMDGPFFSIMPFGKTGYHSLTSVTFTPHITSHNELPIFDCQKYSPNCNEYHLENCNECIAKPKSAWPYMSQLAKNYLKEELQFEYSHSLFSMKPILKSSEIDDSRPTVIRQFSSSPTYVSVLSGKINTVYDLDEVLDNGKSN